MMKPRDEYFSRELKYSLGIDIESGSRYVSFPVTNGIADYEEYYRLSDEQYALFLANEVLAVEFVEEGRRQEHDDLLLQKPGWNRGIPT